ncbi:chondroitin sulfate N-acetylgalactosaminyltransferase 1-like [Montipora foliosa]|uniref:chondroitin sulfate N-acetylgalactosaminyltransferase 1-like n=1 Tax=Montipora foliosa TaxID=591990 RepID=UPI0035F1C1D4
MAFFSVRIQRLVLYLLLVLTVALLYQIYSHSGDLVKKQQLRDESAKVQYSDFMKLPPKDAVIDKKEIKGNVRRREIDMERSNAQLQKEVKRLKSRINKKEELIYRLTAELEKEKSNVNKFKQEAGNLKVQNAELLAEMESRSIGENSGRSEQNPVADAKENSKNNRKVQVNDIRISERVQFQSFAKTHVFEVAPVLRPKEYIFHGQNTNLRKVKSSRKHFLEAQDVAINLINTNTSYRVSTDNVVDGVYRFDINAGVEYELYLKDPSSHKFIAVRLIRPLGQMQPVEAPYDRKKPIELINLILPLSGRLERFQQFIDNFVEVCIKKDKHVFLSVVLYGASDFNNVKSTLKDLEASYGFKKYQLIMRDKPFSRGRALHDGVMYWSGKPNNVLMFFCDVDITFRPEFLRRCRMYAEPEKKVYYPMVFSLYNPVNVYEDGIVPPPSEQLVIERSHGFWRAYGFGMTCQYRSDYLRVGGFDLNIEGWGSEDLGLYERHLLQSNIRIIRAPDRDLFHYFHEKNCDPSLSKEQYRSCLGSKAIAEGTHTQIAMQLSKLREKYESESQQDDGD